MIYNINHKFNPIKTGYILKLTHVIFFSHFLKSAAYLQCAVEQTVTLKSGRCPINPPSLLFPSSTISLFTLVTLNRRNYFLS